VDARIRGACGGDASLVYWGVVVSHQCELLLAAFNRGESLTVGEALMRYGVYALSQRVGEIEKEGHLIEHEMVKVGKARVCRYSLVRIAFG
jgi:hypothetical protein